MATPVNHDELTGRAAVYRLLAQVYRKEVSAELAAALRDADLLTLLRTEGYEVGEDLPGDPEGLKELRREFSRTFVGPGPHVAPYGSVYHPDDPKKGRLWGDTTTEVRRFASEHGLKFEGEAYDGIPDHIGHELELFALLIEAEATAHGEGDEDKAGRLRNSQRYLLTGHLGRWVPTFCEKVEDKTKSPFYRGVAALTRDLLGDEGTRLAAA